MINEQKIKNLSVPKGKIDVILDTDAYNEIDDQFAISYMLRSKEKLNVKALYAAPFHNSNSSSPGDGMEKSYEEILRLLKLLNESVDTFKGSDMYLKDETTPVQSPAAVDLAKRCEEYSLEKPLYVVAIGAITNIASAILLNPNVAKNCVIVWLGGHGLHYRDTREFNMYQDIAAARVVMNSGAAFVQLPCQGVVSAFRISKADLETYLKGKNELCDYLVNTTVTEAERYVQKGEIWSRVIWDVTAVAWLLNDEDRFMESRIIPTALPTYDGFYTQNPDGEPMRYVYSINRDNLVNDLFDKLTK